MAASGIASVSCGVPSEAPQVCSCCRNSYEFRQWSGSVDSVVAVAQRDRRPQCAWDENTMAQSNGKTISSFLGALILATSTVTSAFAANLTAVDGDVQGTPASSMTVITSAIDDPPQPYDPDGTCEACWIEVDDTSSNGSEASMELFFEDDGEDFTGDLELTLKLDTSAYRYVTISNTTIEHQTSETYVIPEGSDWDWRDVTSVSCQATIPQ